MLNSVVMWMCAHPLQFVTGMAVMCGLLALALVPALNEVNKCGHPRI